MKTFSCFLILTIVLSLSVKAQHSGNALRFDGVNDYVDMGNASTFDVGNAVTYEVWINPDTSQSGFIFNKWVGFAEDKQLVFSGNRVYFYLYNVFGGTQLPSSPTIPLDQFTHVAATYDGSTAKLYINGVFDTSKSVGSGVRNSTGNLYYGYNPVRGDFIAPFKGIIDEVRIWNIARTESEIQSTMNQTLNGNEAGLIGYWKFDEGTGTKTSDATSNHSDGTISGATWVVLDSTLSVELTAGSVPKVFSLEQNYPNPFNPTTTLRFNVPTPSQVTIKIYDMLGREVKTLLDRKFEAGSHTMVWDGKNNQQSSVASGVYFVRMHAGEFVGVKKLVLVR